MPLPLKMFSEISVIPYYYNSNTTTIFTHKMLINGYNRHVVDGLGNRLGNTLGNKFLETLASCSSRTFLKWPSVPRDIYSNHGHSLCVSVVPIKSQSDPTRD